MRVPTIVAFALLLLAACQEEIQSPHITGSGAGFSHLTRQLSYELIFFAGTEETGVATDVNDRGEIVGYFNNGDIWAPRNFRWTGPGGLQELPDGLLRGASTSGRVLIAGPSGPLVVKGSSVEHIDWGLEWEAFRVSAFGFRNDGTIVGGISGPGISFQDAFKWSKDTGIEFLKQPSGGRSGLAHAINAQGAVTGWATTFGPALPTVWINDEPTVLYPFPNVDNLFCAEGWGVEINESNGIAGVCDQHGRAARSAFYWTPEDGGTILSSRDDYSYAFDINNKAEVVGYFSAWVPGAGYPVNRAYRWTKASGFLWLDDDATLSSTAYGINERGWIVGVACHITGCHPALWVPAGTVDKPAAGPLGTRRFAVHQLTDMLEQINNKEQERFEPPRNDQLR